MSAIFSSTSRAWWQRAARRGRLPGIALAVSAVLLLGWHVVLQRDNRQSLAALARAGHPVRLRDLARPAAVPASREALTALTPADTACAHYEAAFRVYPSRRELAGDAALLPLAGDAPPMPPDADFSPAAATALQAYLAAHAASLAALRAGSDLPLGAYQEVSVATGTHFQPHHDAVRRGTRTLALAAMASTQAGDADGAVANLRAAVLLGESLREEPGVEPYAARLAARPPAVQALAWCLSHGRFSAAQLRALGAAFAACDDPAACARAFDAHRVLGIRALNHLTDPDDEQAWMLTGGWTTLQRLQCELLSLNQLELHSFLAASQPLSAALALPPPTRAPATFAAQESASALAGSGFARTLLFQAPLLEQWDDNSLAHTRCAQLALSIELHHVQTGRWPATLADLRPEETLGDLDDTFAPGLLHYLPAADGYRVYSVGHNGVDDGGSEFTPDPTIPPLDEVFRRVFLPPTASPPPALPPDAAVAPAVNPPAPVLP